MEERIARAQEIFCHEVIAMAPDATVAFGEPSNGAYRVQVNRATAPAVTMRISEEELSDIASPEGADRLATLRSRLLELWNLSMK